VSCASKEASVRANLCLLTALALSVLAAPAAADTIEARLLSANKTSVKLNKGSNTGIKVGQIFDLYRQAELYVLPMTNAKQPLVIPQKRIGQVQVFQVEPSTALARIVTQPKGKGLEAKGIRALYNPTAVAPNRKPEFLDGRGKRDPVAWGSDQQIRLKVSNEEDDDTVFEWQVTGGRLRYERTLVPNNVWTAPPKAGDYKLTIVATDSQRNETRTTLTLRSRGIGRSLPTRFAVSGRRYDAKSRFGLAADVAFGGRGEVLSLTPKRGWGSKTTVRVRVPWTYPRVFSRPVEDRELGALAFLGSRAGDYGAVFALDTDRHVVLRYDLNSGWGTFNRPPLMIGKEDGGTGNGRFQRPVDMCLSRKGDLYVLDADQRCVQVFEVSRGKSAQAQFLVSFGSPGQGKQRLKTPVALAVGRDDVVHVLDAGRRAVVLYRAFRPIGEISVGEPEEKLNGLAVDPYTNQIYVLSKSKARVRRYSRSGQLLSEFGAPIRGLPSKLEAPLRLRLSPTREVWVIDREGNSVVRFSESGRFIARTGGIELGSPLQVAAGSHGGFAVLDRGKYQVTRFDRDGWIRARFGSEGSKSGQFEEPIDLAMGAGGDTFVLDADQRRVHRFSPRGRALGAFSKGLEGVIDLCAVNDKSYLMVLQQRAKANFGLLNQEPRMVRSFGRDYVDDLTPRSGCVTGITGTLTGRGRESARPVYWSTDDDREHLHRCAGSRPSAVDLEFDEITDVEPSPTGQVFVADPGDEQIVIVSPSGRVMAKLKGSQFEDPSDLSVDAFGHVFVYDKNTKQVLELVPARK
jgi:DNA-binding beta-propeller fold protein YncE